MRLLDQVYMDWIEKGCTGRIDICLGIDDAIMVKRIELHPGKLGNRSRGASTCATR